MLGWYDYKFHKRTHVVWDIAWTTKAVKREDDSRPVPAVSSRLPAKQE
jgi:hypothetical protein